MLLIEPAAPSPPLVELGTGGTFSREFIRNQPAAKEISAVEENANENVPPNDDELESPDPALRLDYFLKKVGRAETGGQAKLLIQNGDVKVNGAIETKRRRKLVPGDVVEVGRKRIVVQ